MKLFLSLVRCFSLAFLACATAKGDGGVEWGGFQFHPEAGVAATHDNRVLLAGSDAQGDYYSELATGMRVNNLPARYNLSAQGNYGQRLYSKYIELDDDFYNTGIILKSDQSLLNLALAADYRKALNYGSLYNPDTGGGLDAILTDRRNRRFSAKSTVSYDLELSERTSLVPEYGFLHYSQEYEGNAGGDARWQVHRVNLPMRYAYSDKTFVTAGASASLQANKEEDGYVAEVYVGAQNRASHKTTYSLKLGVSVADYETSGTEAGAIADARVLWRATGKSALFAFLGNRFQPGYGGGSAREVYRGGYGANWRFKERWSLDVQGLHDYDRMLDEDASTSSTDGKVHHYFTGQIKYRLPKYAEISAVSRYVNDEAEKDRVVFSLRLDVRI